MEKSFVPAKDVATFTVYNILEAVEHAGSSSIDLAASAELQQVSAELDRIKAEARTSQQNLKLTDIKAEGPR